MKMTALDRLELELELCLLERRLLMLDYDPKPNFGDGHKFAPKGLNESSGNGNIKTRTKRSKGSGKEESLTTQTTTQLKKGIRSLKKHIAEHEDKINHPSNHYPEWDSLDDAAKQGNIKHWKKEIDTAKKSIRFRIDELSKRGEKYEDD